MLRLKTSIFLKRLGTFIGACLLFLILPAQPPSDPGQNPQNRLEIIKTDLFHYATFGADSVRIRKLIGNVHLRQDTTDMLCDSAYQFIDSNYVVAYSNVRIILSQERSITAKKLTYDGRTKIANLTENVVLRDSNVVMRTSQLQYYRDLDYAEYTTGGTLESQDNVLTSKRGTYYPKQEMAFFKDDVKLVNPKFRLTTDTLGYNTEHKVAFFMAPTQVYDSINTMYTEDGYYDTQNDFAFLHQRPHIGDTTYTLYADTIQYDQKGDFGTARHNIRLVQTDSSLVIHGQYAEFRSKTETSFVTDSAFAVQFFKDDTLYFFADTLASYKDTTAKKRYFQAYHGVSFFMNELQGVCDSLSYWYDDSLMFFYREPALWSAESQITGDTIIIRMSGGAIDSLSIPRAPFVASREDTMGYDQIKGKMLHAKFEDKKLKRMWLYGNSESIYFTKDEKDKFIGMNKAKCTDMFIEFKDNKPNKIMFKEKPEGEFFPIHMVAFKKNELEGLNWRGEERPSRPEWVLRAINRADSIPDLLKAEMQSLVKQIESITTEVEAIMADPIFGKYSGEESQRDSLKAGLRDSIPISAKDGVRVSSKDSVRFAAGDDGADMKKDRVKGGREKGDEAGKDSKKGMDQVNAGDGVGPEKSGKDKVADPGGRQTKAQKKAIALAKQQEKLERARLKIANRAQRNLVRQEKRLGKIAYRKRMQMQPKDAEFNHMNLPGMKPTKVKKRR